MPAGFRFAVKMLRTITHERRPAAAEPLARFLGEALGPLRVQLPPGLKHDAATAGAFFAELRRRHDGPVVLEPRHASWFTGAMEASLAGHRNARAAADPAAVPRAAGPGGLARPRPSAPARGAQDLLRRLFARRMQTEAGEGWCIFDNTALGEAARNAPGLPARL